MSSFYLQTKDTIAFHSSKWMKCEANLRTYRSLSKIENVILLLNTKLKTKFQNFALDATCMSYWSHMKPYAATILMKIMKFWVFFLKEFGGPGYFPVIHKKQHLSLCATSTSTFSEVDYFMSKETCTSFLW